MTGQAPVARSARGVQSLDRAFGLLEAMADSGGVIGLSQLAEKADLPLATIHRLVRTLVDLGYVRQEASREYSLGPRLLRLADAGAKRIGAWAQPALTAAVAELGESVNLAVLEGDEIVYVAQVQPSVNSMRMFTEVGRRTFPHSTAVGKAILAHRSDRDVLAMLARTGMPRHTAHTLTEPEAFLEALAVVRERGYALDEGEQEVGVRCVAMVVPETPVPMAVSMSGPLPRMGDDVVRAATPVLHTAALAISAEVNRVGAVATA